LSGNTGRVVVTGMAGISPIGSDWTTIEANLRNGVSGIQRIEDWAKYEGMNTELGGPVDDFSLPPHFTRKKIRSMGRVSQMAAVATETALADAGLLNDPSLKSGRCGVAYGSSTGSTGALLDFANLLINHNTDGLNATTYIRMMGHTTPVNLGVYLGLTGRVMTTSSACTSGSQGIGYAYETIRSGAQDVMIAGGGEELCPTIAAVFDTLFATSAKNDTPQQTPSPYDRDRDGLVVSEGAGTLILESLEHAQARGAEIHAEIVGFGTNADGQHVTQPNSATMETAMRLALESAGLKPEQVGYVNGHGTATDRGDVAESQATERLFGKQMPISTLKGHTGHTLGACGALEAWATIEMQKRDWYCPTLNLNNPDPECGELDYICGDGKEMQNEFVMSNNFAFGGINTSLIFKRI